MLRTYSTHSSLSVMGHKTSSGSICVFVKPLYLITAYNIPCSSLAKLITDETLIHSALNPFAVIDWWNDAVALSSITFGVPGILINGIPNSVRLVGVHDMLQSSVTRVMMISMNLAVGTMTSWSQYKVTSSWTTTTAKSHVLNLHEQQTSIWFVNEMLTWYAICTRYVKYVICMRYVRYAICMRYVRYAICMRYVRYVRYVICCTWYGMSTRMATANYALTQNNSHDSWMVAMLSLRTNPLCQRIPSANPVYESRLQIPSANPVCKSRLQIPSANPAPTNPVCKSCAYESRL